MWLFRKNRLNEIVDEKKAEENFARVRPELEKNDLPAIIIAALITFVPYIIAIIGVLLIFAWRFG